MDDHEFECANPTHSKTIPPPNTGPRIPPETQVRQHTPLKAYISAAKGSETKPANVEHHSYQVITNAATGKEKAGSKVQTFFKTGLARAQLPVSKTRSPKSK